MDSIHIQGYKSIKDATIELKPINILIGANGSGKSNFLSFFEFLNKLYERNLQIYVGLKGIEKFLYKGRAVTSKIYAKVIFARDEDQEYFNYYKVNLKAGDEHFLFEKEFSGYIDENKGIDDPGDNLAFGGGESNIQFAKNGYRANYINQYLKGIKQYHFHDTGRNSPFNRTNNIQDDIYYLYEDGGNIAAILYSIKETNIGAYNVIIETIQSMAPYFSDFYFEPNENNLLRLQWRDRYSSVLYSATDLSDGTIRFIALTVLFLQPKLPATIIIDEPELGLHPFAIATLAGLIQSAAARGTQIIAATQSAELIDHFKPEDVIAVDQLNGESSFKRLSSDELSNWLYDYSLGDLWKQNIIGKAQP